MIDTRDIRLDLEQIIALRDAGMRRRREIDRRLAAHTGAKPGMVAELEQARKSLDRGLIDLEVAQDALVRRAEHRLVMRDVGEVSPSWAERDRLGI